MYVCVCVWWVGQQHFFREAKHHGIGKVCAMSAAHSEAIRVLCQVASMVGRQRRRFKLCGIYRIYIYGEWRWTQSLYIFDLHERASSFIYTIFIIPKWHGLSRRQLAGRRVWLWGFMLNLCNTTWICYTIYIGRIGGQRKLKHCLFSCANF